MVNLTKNHLIALSVLALLLFGCAYAVLVWPTPYIIVHDKRQVFRVNRFTGVRQRSTDWGWKTEAELKVEKEAWNRARSQQILEDLKQITIDDSRDDITKLAIYNPTEWSLSGSGENTVVEYYTVKRGLERFLAKSEARNHLKPKAHNDLGLMVWWGSAPSEVRSLSAGTNFLQRITITFHTATNNDESIELLPPFVLKYDRPWVAQDTPPDESQ